MKFEENKNFEIFGWKIGYLFSYFLFTTALFLILAFLNKLPNNWDYLNIMLITIFIALVGIIFKRLLK